VRAAAREAIRQLAARRGVCIVVASLGRSGSSMLAQTCAESLISGRRFPLRTRLGGALFRFALTIDEMKF
jgi:hypothetical protein